MLCVYDRIKLCVCVYRYVLYEKRDTIFGIYVILCLCLSCRSDDTIIAKNYKVCDGGTGQFVELITRKVEKHTKSDDNRDLYKSDCTSDSNVAI